MSVLFALAPFAAAAAAWLGLRRLVVRERGVVLVTVAASVERCLLAFEPFRAALQETGVSARQAAEVLARLFRTVDLDRDAVRQEFDVEPRPEA